MGLTKIIIITIVFFIVILRLNYIGAVGRIEGRNQATGAFQDLGSVSEKEEAAYFEGTHKKLAFKQALIGAIIWSTIIFLILYFDVFELIKKVF